MLQVLDDGFFRRLCEGLGFICIAVDTELRIVFWNEQATHHFEHTQAEMVGTAFLEILDEADRDAAHKLFFEAMGQKQPRDMEVKYPQVDGQRTTLVLIISPIINDAGLCVGASAGMRDITQRKRMSQELSQSRRMASLGRVAGGIAHHFNNILGGMLTSIDYVLSSDSPRELRKTLRLLAQSIGRATRITNQLAAFAESENELVEWKELNPVLDDFITKLRPKIADANQTLETNFETIHSDPYESQRVQTVLESIAQNAMEAMPPGGKLSVNLTRDDDVAVIQIRDNGCGIPENLKEHIFEPFFTTKGELAGGSSENIGLGLAAVHGMVGEMGGTIRLNSKIGEGTEVTIRLPLQRKK
ncbi:MAG: PAS domain S-box protein [Planctomycetes bacterium]|nr:PAS domain S-box protein [Planctomycetota bacterium]